MEQSIAFDPLIAPLWIAILVALALISALATGRARLRSFLARAFAAAVLGIALMNPQSVTEDRQYLPDIALLITDRSESMKIGERERVANELTSGLSAAIKAQDNVELITLNIDPSEDGTQLTRTLIDGVSNLPADRIAGIFTITDGQVHDLPTDLEGLLPDNTPFHALIVGSETARDRRLNAITAPRFGLVDETVDFDITVDDPGHEGSLALIQLRLNGEVQDTFNVPIGDKVSIPVKVERRGSNTVEIIAQGVEGELTQLNNVFVQEIAGIRDRLRVLLITGEPHSGGRAWRNLLKSDPSVDLVQFSILRPPGKSVGATSRELSLIAFPTRELFEEKVEEFDLIIFDQYRRRNILSPYYIQNIARYVDNGGALLVAAGPPFASPQSLSLSPLASVLPARPTGESFEEGFSPELTDKGQRHPITAGFHNGAADIWGRWFRTIEANVLGGDVLMSAPDDRPLLVLDSPGEGRVALLLSDQAWLWAKGFEGGGPYNELFRRLAHWLMGEPDLEAEKLSAKISDGIMTVERTTLEDADQSVEIITPDGLTGTLNLTRVGPGLYQGKTEASTQGSYRVQSAELHAIAAAGALNPKEFSTLLPTSEFLAPLSAASNGHISIAGEDVSALPGLRRTRIGSNAGGSDWAGLVNNERYDVTASKRVPLAPILLFFILFALSIAWAWRQESR